MKAKAKTNGDGPKSVRFTAEDKRIVAALHRKLGVQALTELLRQALRALAEKEGLKI